MDLKNISLFKQLTQKMSWLNERQKVLAQNVANANTPGYRSKDLKKISFQSHLNNTGQTDSGRSRTVMRVSDNRHISAVGSMPTRFEIRQENSNFDEASPDGNSVDLERELTKMAEVQMEYTMATNLYRKHIGMIKTALGKR